MIGELYLEYQNRLKKNNALDFDDLLVKTVELFTVSMEILDYYQERFRYIMVDEYQDTNTVQFRLVSLLQKNMEIFAWWGMTISRFTASAGRILKIFSALNRRFRGHV